MYDLFIIGYVGLPNNITVVRRKLCSSIFNFVSYFHYKCSALQSEQSGSVSKMYSLTKKWTSIRELISQITRSENQ